MRALLPKQLILKFNGEKAWREGVEAIIKAHPEAPLNPRGNFELQVPQEIADWAKAKLPDDSCRTISVDERPAGGEALSWQDRGKGVSREFNDPDWLDREADKLEEENRRLRAEIFS